MDCKVIKFVNIINSILILPIPPQFLPLTNPTSNPNPTQNHFLSPNNPLLTNAPKLLTSNPFSLIANISATNSLLFAPFLNSTNT
jgi:hypothetical protein